MCRPSSAYRGWQRCTQWRYLPIGPPTYRAARIRYDPAAVRSWLDAQDAYGRPTSSGDPTASGGRAYRDANHREHAHGASCASGMPSGGWPPRRSPSRPRRWVDPTLSKITVGEWLPTWLALQVQLKPHDGALRGRPPPPDPATLGAGAAGRSPTRMSQAGCTASRCRGLAPATVRYAHRVLSLALTAAVEAHVL